MNRAARVVGFALALVSFWAPWVAHKAAGLSLAEQDLTEFPKFMPQVRDHELLVVRETFYLPLIVLATTLIVLAARPAAANSASRWLARGFAVALALIVLPPYPFFLDGFQSSEFQVQQTLSVGAMALILATPWLGRAPERWVRRFLALGFMLGALVPTVQFFWMKAALDDIYHQPVAVGWGVWAGLIGFGLLVFSYRNKEQR